MPTLSELRKKLSTDVLRRKIQARAKAQGFTKERAKAAVAEIKRREAEAPKRVPLIAGRRKPPTLPPETKARVQAATKGLPEAIAKRRAEARPIPLRGRARTTIRSKRSKLLEALRKRAEA